MDIFMSIGKNLNKKINTNDLRKLTSQLSYLSDEELRDKVIIMCLSNNIDCQEIINLPHNNCRKELMIVLQSAV